MGLTDNFRSDLFGAIGDDFKLISGLKSLQNNVAHLTCNVERHKCEEYRIEYARCVTAVIINEDRREYDARVERRSKRTYAEIAEFLIDK